MRLKKKVLITFTFLALAFTIAVPNASAGSKGFAAVCKHIKTKYHAKKVKIPFMWLARFAVKVIRPAGVKSFRVTIYKDLKFSKETLDQEMKVLMNDSFDNNWSPLLRVRSYKGNQVYLNIRESGKNLKVVLVSIEKDGAVVVRAKFSPDKLAKFIEDPKIFGISMGGKTNSKELLTKGSDRDKKVIYEEDEEDSDNEDSFDKTSLLDFYR